LRLWGEALDSAGQIFRSHQKLYGFLSPSKPSSG